MKEIKTFDDIWLIVVHKLDVVDLQGHTIPFVRFISMKLVDIIYLLHSGWTYDKEGINS